MTGLAVCLLLPAPVAHAQAGNPAGASPETDRESRAAVMARVSTLGVGGELVVALTDRLRLRGGGNWFRVSDTLDYHGISYTGPLKFGSADALVDWLPHGQRFRISPGIVFYNAAGAALTALIPPGASFALGETRYVSDRSTPVLGSVHVNFRRATGEVLVGWGDPLRSPRRLSTTFEAGVIFQGEPQVTLALNGFVCSTDGSRCRSTADPAVHADIAEEAQRIRAHESTHLYLRFYPVAAAGLAYRF